MGQRTMDCTSTEPLSKSRCGRWQKAMHCVPRRGSSRWTRTRSAPEMLWEWEEPSIHLLIQNARTFRREVVQCSCAKWEELAQENQRIWDMHYLPRPLYEPWETWRAW